MDIFSHLSIIANGSFSAFNIYILFRIMNIEKDAERERKFFINFKNSEQETNKKLDERLRSIELECSKRWSTWKM